MKRINPPQAAPMPKAEEDIKNNSMKLYAYLMTIAGVADYPDNTRMFRQKNLTLTKIKEIVGITDKTVKLYLYYLEENGLVIYKGQSRFDFNEYKQEDYEKFKDYRLAVQDYAAKIWKIRNKEEKDGVYYIPRPYQYTPVPEITLDRLNKDFQVSELELDIYLFLCKYRDECVKNKQNYKAMTYENFRDILGLEKCSTTHKSIFCALTFLEKLQLISFSVGYYSNKKMAKIPVFKITEVGYYIQEPLIEFTESELITECEVADLKKLNERIKIGCNKFKERVNNEKI